MKNQSNRGLAEIWLIFLVFPLLSVPFLLLKLRRGLDKGVILITSLLVGILSYKYIPSITNDKVDYIERYFAFSTYSFEDLVDRYNSGLITDFIFDFIIFAFARLDINFNYMFLVLTSFTVFSILLFLKKTISKLTGSRYKYNIIYFVLGLLIFSLGTLFSGVRFYFASSFFIWSIYYLFIDRKVIISTLFFAVAILTHFSFAFFLPGVLFILFKPNLLNLKILLAVSLAFILLPKDSMTSILNLVELPESYSSKVMDYSTLERQTTDNANFLILLNNLWLYFLYFFLLFINKENKSKIYLILVVFLSLVNITYSVPTIFNRYTVIIKLFLVLYLIYLHIHKNIKKEYFYFFIFLFVINTLVSMYILRLNILASYRLSDMWIIINIFSKQNNPEDFLY